MLRIILGCLAGMVVTAAHAGVAIDPLVHKINFQLSAEQWVTTKNALVNVNINASVNDNSLDKIQMQALEKLSKLAKADWHIISYDRSQDKSGLENIKLVAQGRLNENELTGLRDRAKNMSRPGETYTVDTIQFTPNEEEIRNASIALRENIYSQIQNEIYRLVKAYPEQKYYVHEINFYAESAPLPMAAQNVMFKAASAPVSQTNGGASAPMSVGDKLRLNANVTLSTQPDPNLIKTLIH